MTFHKTEKAFQIFKSKQYFENLYVLGYRQIKLKPSLGDIYIYIYIYGTINLRVQEQYKIEFFEKWLIMHTTLGLSQ